MSMNLCFDVIGGGHVEFPFQTPTNLTYKVLKESNTKKRLEIIEKWMNDMSWESELIINYMLEIEFLLNNPNLILSLI